MNSKDQEKIYKLYEDFKNIETTQPSANLANVQHPNNSRYSHDFLWAGIYDPTKKLTLTPRSEQEEGESKFKYRDKQGEVLSLIKVDEDGVAHLINKRSGAKIKIPLSGLKELKEI
jgi:hypothetical protein